MRSFGYHHRLTPDEHAEARAALERAVEQAPANPDCWAMLSWMYTDEYGHGFNARPGSLDRALTAARRAVDIAPSNHLAHQALARAHFFRKEMAACRNACERALALNPLDGSNEAIFLITFMGEWDRGTALIRRAMELNPHHPGWYRLVLGVRRVPQGPLSSRHRRGREGQCAGRVLDERRPGGGIRAARRNRRRAQGRARSARATGRLRGRPPRKRSGKWFAARASPRTRWTDCGRPVCSRRDQRRQTSGAAERARPRPASGLSCGRSSTPAAMRMSPRSRMGYPTRSSPGCPGFRISRSFARASATDQAWTRRWRAGALRHGGKSAAGGFTAAPYGAARRTPHRRASLGGDTYDRPFQPDAIFALQDELVPRIVSTVADQHGVLVHSMSAAIGKKSDAQLSPHEAALRVFGFHERMSADEHEKVRSLLERAVEQAPDDSDCWAMLATVYTDEHMFGFNVRPDPLGRAQAAARRAVELSPSSALASQALAQSLFFRKELQACRPVAERTITLNPMDGAIRAFMGILLALCGDWERGCAAADAAMTLNPHFPGWYWLAPLFHAHHKGDYRGAVSLAARINIPGYFWVPLTVAAALGRLGDLAAARRPSRTARDSS